MQTRRLLSLATMIALMMLGCSKDSDEPSRARLAFAFEFTVGEDALAFGQLYNVGGTAVTFSTANYYLGGLQLTQQNGTIIDLSDQYLLAGLNTAATLNEDLDISNIIHAKFFIGVDPTTNAQTETDFTSRPTSDPLGLQDPAMHWNWNTGYKFLRVDGDADTDGDGAVDTGIAYHIGSDPFLKSFDRPVRLELQGGDNTVTFALDLAQLLEGVDLSTEIDTHTSNDLPLAERISSNMEAAFTLQ